MLNNTSYKRNPEISRNPEKVLQFGTGVLLRGLCDYQIDKANKQGVFNGNIVIVKSTSNDISEFTDQDNLYTVCVRGVENNVLVETNTVIESISRVLAAEKDWQKILETAESPNMQIVVSNTTEVGLQYLEEKIGEDCPVSFPAKLTAWLLRRYNTNKLKVIVIPTELLVDNGKILHQLVLKQALANNLGQDFITWVNETVLFCSSLVDRIVPGKPHKDVLDNLFKELNYVDNNLLVSEVYNLWAIEGENLMDVLSFASVNTGVKLEKNIEKLRELKLRLLNAPHTLMCGMAFLSGFTFIKEALSNTITEKYISHLLLTELSQSLPIKLDNKVTERYINEVMDRFRNPYLEHKWHSITLQYTTKMRMRAIPLLINYYATFNTVPQYFTRCFAAYILFMKSTELKDGKYYGTIEGNQYQINCDSADYFYKVWQTNNVHQLVKEVLSNTTLWGDDLTLLPSFASNVETHLSNMIHVGVKEIASTLNVYA